MGIFSLGSVYPGPGWGYFETGGGILKLGSVYPRGYIEPPGVLRGWGRAQITVDILGREAKKVEKHWPKGCTVQLYSIVAVVCMRRGPPVGVWSPGLQCVLARRSFSP